MPIENAAVVWSEEVILIIGSSITSSHNCVESRPDHHISGYDGNVVLLPGTDLLQHINRPRLGNSIPVRRSLNEEDRKKTSRPKERRVTSMSHTKLVPFGDLPTSGPPPALRTSQMASYVMRRVLPPRPPIEDNTVTSECTTL